jgi:ADP-ribose pyrophosphatase YjhB (NUDIX family)
MYLSKRIDTSKMYYFRHQTPGGTIKYNETPIEACIRKTEEETDIKLKKNRIKYITTEVNKEGYILELYTTELKESEEPKRCKPSDNTEWKLHKIRNIFKKDTIVLIPILEEYSVQIIAVINKKNSYLNTPKELLEKARTVKSFFKK